MDHWNCPVPSQVTWENNQSPLNEMHIHQQNHWNDILFYWYQSYHWTIGLTNRVGLYILDMCVPSPHKLLFFYLGRTITKKMYHCISFYCIVSEITSKTRASGFIRGSKHLERIKALGLRPRAFICFSVSGTPDETLALVFDILLEALVWSQHILALMNVLAYVKCFIDHTNY